jgi:hypothetical protein
MVFDNTTLFCLSTNQKIPEKRFLATKNIPKMADAYVEKKPCRIYVRIPQQTHHTTRIKSFMRVFLTFSLGRANGVPNITHRQRAWPFLTQSERVHCPELFP